MYTHLRPFVNIYIYFIGLFTTEKTMNSSGYLSVFGFLTALCLLPGTLACSCLARPRVLQDDFCRANYVLEVNVTKNELVKGEDNRPGFESFGHRRHTIITTKVYKSTPAYQAVEDKTHIYTAPHSAACGVYLEEGEKYVIFGFSGGPLLSMHLCRDFGIKTELLTADQLRGVQYTYQENCDKCETQYCREPEGCGQQQADRQSCVFDLHRQTCFSKHALCKPVNSTVGRMCDWVDGGSNKLDECLNNLPEPF